MKIALLLERFDSTRGGAETYATQLARGLICAGHSVEVFCQQAGAASGEVVVHRLEVGARTRAGRIRTFAERCAEAVRGGGFDVVEGLGRTLGQDVLRPPGGTLSAARAGTLRSLSGRPARLLRRLEWAVSPAARMTAALEREQFHSARTHFITNSRMVAEDIRRDHDIEPDRIHVIYTGIDLERFSPQTCESVRAESRRKLGLEAEELGILMVAHNFRLKGLGPLLAACAQLSQRVSRPFRLLVAGRGPTQPYLRAAREVRSPGTVSFLGAVNDVLPLYAAADVVAHPTYYDTGSNVTLEAWACGVATITSRYNGAVELLPPEAADWVLNDPDDVLGLADRLGTFFDDGHRRSAGQVLRGAMQGLSLTDHCGRVLELFRQVRAGKERG